MLSWITNPIVAGLAGGLVGSLVTFAGSTYTFMSRGGEIEYVSSSILAGENKDSALPGRKIALRALSNFSGVEISDKELNEWTNTGTMPTSSCGGQLGPNRNVNQILCCAGSFPRDFQDVGFRAPEGR